MSYATLMVNVDAERDRIVAELTQSGCVQEVRSINGFQHVPEGRNGGGGCLNFGNFG